MHFQIAFASRVTRNNQDGRSHWMFPREVTKYIILQSNQHLKQLRIRFLDIHLISCTDFLSDTLQTFNLKPELHCIRPILQHSQNWVIKDYDLELKQNKWRKLNARVL